MYLFPYTSLSDNYEDFEWRNSAEYDRIRCKSCQGVSSHCMGDPIDIVVKREPSIFDPAHPVVSVLPVEFANFIKTLDTRREIVWGNILVGNERSVSKKYVTAYMPKLIRFDKRGGCGAVYRECPECGSITQSMYEDGSGYILSKWSDRNVLFPSGRRWPGIVGDMASEFDWSQFRGVRFVQIEVRRCPEDGFILPGDPDWASLCSNFCLNTSRHWSVVPSR